MMLDSDTVRIAMELFGLIFVAGGAWYELKALRKDVQRLEKKQEEANNVKTRTAVIEELNKSYDKRIAKLEERILMVMAGRNLSDGK